MKVKSGFRKIMINGGFVLLIATVAIVAYFLVLEYANDWFDNSIEEVRIVLHEDGSLSVPMEGDISGLYSYWEADGGTVKPQTASEDAFLRQQDRPENLWHTAYTTAAEHAVWAPEDADGNVYETATVRAIVYMATEEAVSRIGDSSVQKVMTITLTKGNDGVKQAEDRLFTNPVRADSGSDWNQIYLVDQSAENTYTLAYRTGNAVPTDENLTLCWSGSQAVLKETDLMAGGIPHYTAKEGTDAAAFLASVNQITCEITEKTVIEAYIVNINSAGIGSQNVPAEERKFSAEITLGEKE